MCILYCVFYVIVGLKDIVHQQFKRGQSHVQQQLKRDSITNLLFWALDSPFILYVDFYKAPLPHMIFCHLKILIVQFKTF